MAGKEPTSPLRGRKVPQPEQKEKKKKNSKPERNQDYRARAITCPAPTPGQVDSFPKEALGRLEAAPEPRALAANLPRGKAATG